MIQRLLIPLDLLLDTRLATLVNITPNVPNDIMLNKEMFTKYTNRPNDNFIEFGLKAGHFREIYEQRDANTLVGARPTRFLFELNRIIADLIELQIREPHNCEAIELDINFYPYNDLTDEETRDIISAICARLQLVAKVNSVYIADAALSPLVIKSEKYTGVFHYDVMDWCKHHFHESIPEQQLVPIPSVTMYSGLFFNDLVKLKEAMDYQNGNGATCNIYDGYKAMFAPYFGFEVMSPTVISLADIDFFIENDLKTNPHEP